MKKVQGRMIRVDIRKSKKIAALSPKSLSLFCLMLPHFNSHGKMNGDLHFIKGEVCPLIKWFTLAEIQKSLIEISEKTNVKWFEKDELFYIHSLNFTEHQDLREERMGEDHLPSYLFPENSGSSPGVVPPEYQDQYKDNMPKKDRKERFDVFWKVYPKKFGKIMAEKAFLKLDLTDDLLKTMIEAIEKQKNTDQWQKEDGQFIPYPATWLNGRRWEDEAEVKKNGKSKKPFGQGTPSNR